MRLIELIATFTGDHYIECGIDANEMSSFRWQLWITKHGHRAVDWLQSLSLGFVSFQGGDIWVHNSNDVPRANLFGEQKYSEVAVVANEKPNLVKLLDSIGVHSDGKWSVESVVIPATLNQPNGAYSMIPKDRFKKREGIWQSEFLRNMKTTSSTANPIEAINGETLRGYSAVVTLRNTDSNEVKLFKVQFNMTANK
jgi:hypothetical protein